MSDTPKSQLGDLAGLDPGALAGLGLDAGALAGLGGDCAVTRQSLSGALTARLDQVQAEIAERNRAAVAAGAGTPGWATEISASASLSETAARLQAATAALAGTAHTGPCTADCGCGAALSAAATTYHFPAESPLACDLAADDGDIHDRIGEWQRVLTRVDRRDALPDTADGIALRFPFDVELAASLGRLAAAEYRCCSFGSYTLVIDGDGLRVEIRMPAGAAGTMAAVVGRPDTSPAGGRA
ncbi:hypothetical protein ACQPZX_24960 [Actinoplanes sp. CA-142083]|uniref:hypothetical protein n=1 Tax=Actinoplanes sp. CA-142083 TaxID=3239903 RepID=UPI003D939EFA